MGGGLAVLSYVDIAKSGLFDNIEVITFGAPRVGNKSGLNGLTNKPNRLDIISKVILLLFFPFALPYYAIINRQGHRSNVTRITNFVHYFRKGRKRQALKSQIFPKI